MNKFIVLFEDATNIECLLNVSNICWVKLIANNKLHIRFSDGSENVYYKNNFEITEMLLGKPWYVNIYNTVKYLFGKRVKNGQVRKL